MSYNPTKAAQVIALLLLRSKAKTMDIVKVVKLVYLCDREFLRRWGFPILDENRVAMKHGPVNSTTYRLINGEAGPDPEGWKSLLSDRAQHKIGLARDVGQDELDLLSSGEIEAIDAVWKRFGGMGTWELVRWTHQKENIPEWEDPGDTSKPITLLSIFKAMKMENAEEMVEAIEDHRYIDSMFDEIRVH
ncbi:MULTISPECIES: Panacea domain-containing protein [unclassified Rhizobium]|uniref:Panacea domain-containing protein n=1 Tax=unclassified Rhizobium TaxID=2613769 RepID=UPI00161CE071|nr:MULTISPECIES: Panacea domain-containing protein [unclassified Rhizobium]MBB3318844.1 putative phage-associated protein [Rhizobium sp. BK181]MCS3744373.1 putative phage-associated protein [Rhizobium sp. BK661]MCS4094780.1 putative phage-associated protein [Rhizobium sp. BK176]